MFVQIVLRSRPFWLCGVLLFGSIDLHSAEVVPPQPHSTPALIEEGKRIFQTQCGGCHGPNGEGAGGPQLAHKGLRGVREPEALFVTIRSGIPGTAMPAGPQLQPPDVWKVVSFIESLNAMPVERYPGNAEHGSRTYAESGCAACHWLDGKGGLMGPDLTGIGVRRSAVNLEESLFEPGAAVDAGFRPTEVLLGDGRIVSGYIVNENPFSIQVRGFDGRLCSIDKRDVVEIDHTVGRSMMPAAGGTLGKQEVRDLVAFLLAQRSNR